MTSIRMKNKLKLNINLYRVFIMPLYRLAFTMERIKNKSANFNILELHIKKTFKRFLSLPRSTPNKVIYRLLGNIKDIYS
jgi:hypothetical protein